MKNAASTNDDTRKLGELIDDIEVAMLTTVGPDGTLVSRPLQTLKVDPAGNLLFFTDAGSGKVHDLKAKSKVNVAYANPSSQTYVSVTGHATVVRDRALIEELWKPVHKAFFPKGKDDPDLAVLRVDTHGAEYWEASGNFIARAIDFGRALSGEGPDAMGEHGKLNV